jgi:hypothetical protein
LLLFKVEVLNWVRSGNSEEVIAWFNNPEISDDEKQAVAFGLSLPDCF